MTDVLAAVDIGTNSFHLVVARVFADRRFEVIASEKEMIRLGSGSGDMKELTPAAIDRGVACLQRFRQVAAIFGAPIRAVATSAVREAENRDLFLDRCLEEAGVAVEVISGVEEARLIHLGVLQALPVYDKQLVLIDIGGGSTEFLVGKAEEVLWARSLKVGAIRLTERFFPNGVTSPAAVAECRDFLRSFLAPNLAEAASYGFDVAVGSSGTIENVALVAALGAGRAEPRSSNGLTVTTTEIDAAVERLVGATTPTARNAIAGVEAKRSDLLPAGALLLQASLKQLGADHVVVSTFALREGVLLDSLQELQGAAGASDGLHHLSDLRRGSVLHVLDRYGEPGDREHAIWSTELALQIFAQSRAIHGLDDRAIDYLEAGGLLANIGRCIAHEAHHLHSAYLVRNTDHFAGFTSHEIELIAQIARYHRKSGPKSKHPEFASLRVEDQRLVRCLAGLLRIAIGLDRGYAQVIQGVFCRYQAELNQLTIGARVPSDSTLASLELYTAAARTELAEQALGVQIRITAEPLLRTAAGSVGQG